tara:strand:+ start:4113 stop:4970 length:858 start_codon:yes stop_codon:yes gene_type:complete
MEFIKGEYIKPSRTTDVGQVIFTNGTEDCLPNEITCVAYGYKWDPQTNTCRAFAASEFSTVMKTTLTIGNKTNGPRNETKEGSYYNNINGSNNTIGRQVQNSSVSGTGNEIEDNVHNASVSGYYSKIQRMGEVGIGGGNYSQADTLNGYAQSSTIHCIARTSGPGTFIARVGGVGASIPVQSHSVIIFKMTGVVIKEAGGSYWTFSTEWAVKMDNNKQATYCAISSSIGCGPAPEEWLYPTFLQLTGGEDYPYQNLQLNVNGLPELDLMYNIKLELLETRTINNF